jgi:hypothetical protein
VIDAIASRCGRRGLGRYPNGAAYGCLQTRILARGTHRRTRWRHRTHALQRTMSCSSHTATRSTCTAERHHCGTCLDARQCGDNCLPLHQLS